MNRYKLKSNPSAQVAKAMRDLDASYDNLSSQEYKIEQAMELLKPDKIILQRDILGRSFSYSKAPGGVGIVYVDFKVIHRGVDRPIMIGLNFVAIWTAKEIAVDISTQIARVIVAQEKANNRAGVLDDWSN